MPESISVRTLVAYQYCVNAGKIEYARQTHRVETPHFRIPNLSYAPGFKYLELQHRQRDCIVHAFLSVVSGLLFAYFAWKFEKRTEVVFALACSIACLLALAYSYRCAWELHFISAQLREYRAKRNRLLPENATEPVFIHWWEIIKSGYNPEAPSTYRCDEAGLFGRPWRLLIHERTRDAIPVVRHKVQDGEHFTAETSLDYFVELAALCYLVNLHEGRLAKWGLVVDAISRNAYAVPIQPKDMRQAALAASQATKQLSKMSLTEFVIPDSSVCRTCSLAKPRRIKRRLTWLGSLLAKPFVFNRSDVDLWKERIQENPNEPLEVGSRHIIDNQQYLRQFASRVFGWIGQTGKANGRHCDCGDVYRWAPPHAIWERQTR